MCRGEWGVCACVQGRVGSVCMCAGESGECVQGRVGSVCMCVGKIPTHPGSCCTVLGIDD